MTLFRYWRTCLRRWVVIPSPEFQDLLKKLARVERERDEARKIVARHGATLTVIQQALDHNEAVKK